MDFTMNTYNGCCDCYNSVVTAADVGRCHLNQPDLDVCLAKNIEDASRKFKNGVPELALPILEPLRINKMVIGEGTSAVAVVQNFENVDLFGVTESSASKASLDYVNKKMYVESFSPRLQLIGDYKLDGKILVLPIRGQGRFNITLVNAKLTHNIVFEEHTKKGNVYWRIVDYVVTIAPESLSIHFDRLFEGDERLGSELNKVLNENSNVIFEDVRTGYEKSFGLIFKNVADNLFNRVAIDDIFLKD